MNNNYMEGYLVFRYAHIEDNLPYILHAEWSRWHNTDDAGYAMSSFARRSIQAIESLVALGVLRISRGNWYFTAFGIEQCAVKYDAYSDSIVIHIPLENDYLPF